MSSIYDYDAAIAYLSISHFTMAATSHGHYYGVVWIGTHGEDMMYQMSVSDARHFNKLDPGAGYEPGDYSGRWRSKEKLIQAAIAFAREQPGIKALVKRPVSIGLVVYYPEGITTEAQLIKYLAD